MTMRINRRDFCRIVGAAGAAAAPVVAGSTDAADRGIAVEGAASGPVDLDSPPGRLNAFLKIYTSIGRARVWYWYAGTIDARLAGGAIMPLIATDTLIRRDMTPLGDGRFEMLMFEGTCYRPVDGVAPVDHFVNPLNGREVRPLHYREGPYHVGYDVRGPYNPATGDRFPGSGPFRPRFREAGDRIWLHRDNYIDVPHPLPAAEWPLESSGPRQVVGSFATHWSSRTDVGDPAIPTAPSAFHYEAFMGWLPWMLMGDASGQLVWRCAGSKLSALTDLPATARAAFDEKHPRLFLEKPWEGHADLFTDFRRERSPAKP